MTRKYEQRVRAEAAARTRAEILDAAREVLVASERLEFSVGEVAEAAGVARSTIYTTFGSRAGLLAALADDALHRAGMGDVIAAMQLPDARDALHDGLLAGCRMYAEGYRLFRRFRLLGEVDPDAAAPIARSEKDRLGGMNLLAARLHAAGALQAGLPPERAADRLSLLTSFSAFDELHGLRGLSSDAAAEVLLEVARASVLA